MRIVFGCAGMRYDGNTPEHSPLGGSESAVVYMARTLVKAGVDVTVYNHCPNPGDYEGVEYRPWHELFTLPQEDADYFICIRDPKIATAWTAKGHKILWCQDWYDQPVIAGLDLSLVDDIFFVGQWQMEGFCEKMTWPVDRAWVVPNGVVPEYYNREDHVFRGKRMFYSSTPFRGLEHLLHLLPRIRERVIGAELFLYGGMEVYQDPNHERNELYSKFQNMEGVTIKGALGQRELAKEMEQCRILAYPNTFPETCCTTAYEAMAAGNVVVTTYRAGLINTVGRNGILIPGEPGTEPYDSNFVEECCHYLENDPQWGVVARQAWEWALNNRTWFHMANLWFDIFDLIERRDS